MSVTDPDRRDLAVTVAVEALASVGDVGRAEAAARSVAGAGQRARALAIVVEAATRAGDTARARTLTDDAEAAARADTSRVVLDGQMVPCPWWRRRWRGPATCNGRGPSPKRPR